MRLYKGIPPEAIRQVPPAEAEHPIFNGSVPFGMLTAENPVFPSAPGGNEALKNDLDSLGLKYEQTEGRYNLPERSFIVHGPTLEQVYGLGKKYGQEAVIHSEGGQHKFIFTNGPKDAQYHPGTGTYDYWHEGQELPEDYYTKIPGQGAIRLHFDFDHVDALRMNAPAPMAAAPTGAVPHDVAAAPMTAKSEARRLAFQLVRLAKANDDSFHGQFAGQTLPFYGVDNNMFKLGDKVYHAKEDPDDGYRSYLDTIEETTPPSNSIFFKQPVAHVRVERFDHNGDDYVPGYMSDDNQELGHPAFGGYRLVDAQTGHPWLTVGTNFQEDYYPSFHFHYNPPRDSAAHSFQQKADEAEEKSRRTQAALQQHLTANRPGADPLAQRRRELGTQPLPDRQIAPPASAPAPQPKQAEAPSADDPHGTKARFRNLELHERQAVGHALYKHLDKLVKGYVALPQDPPAQVTPDDPPPAGAKTPMRPFAHPLAYDWHDGHTDHHYFGHTSGGVLIRRGLAKQEAPAPIGEVKHPHTDGAIPKKDSPEHATNDQAAGKGVATYRQFALPFGSIQQAPSDLFHYDYRGKGPQVDKLVADHGYKVYYAGGKFGKPDLGTRNYNTGHLMVYDPTPQSGGDFGNQEYTDAWRKTHELAHALTYPELNRIYGEGRRIGKLGHHRSTREALRAVHWEWLAAHKQRELNKQLGIHVPDETFNRELNTVMHDAAHRAVTGKFTEPSEEGFTPHSHKVPLETALGMVREHARNLGLQGDNDILPKGTPVAKKELTIPEALKYLHDGLQQRIDDFAKEALALRQKESLAKGEKGKKLVTDKFHGQGTQMGSSVQPAGPGTSPRRDAAAIRKEEAIADDGNQGTGGVDPQGGLGGSNNMNMGEKKKFKKGAAADASTDQVAGEAGYPAAAAIDSGSGMALKEKNMKKNTGHTTLGPRGSGPPGGIGPSTPPVSSPMPSPMPPMPGAGSGKILPGELAKHNVMCKCESCGKVDHYAKSALAYSKSTKEEDADWEADKVQAQLDSKKQKQSAHPYRKAELEKGGYSDKSKTRMGMLSEYKQHAEAGNHSKAAEAALKLHHYHSEALHGEHGNSYGDHDEYHDRQQNKYFEASKAHEAKKSELAKKSPPGRKKEVEDLKAKGMPASEAFGIAWKQNNEKGKPSKKAEPNTFVDNSKGKGKLPPEKGGEKVTPKKHAEGGNDGMDTTAGKKLGKAALQTSKPSAMGASPPPAMGAAPKMAGAAIPPPHPGMKPMKLPGMSMKPKMPKPPVMGAGSTAGSAPSAAPAMGKAELAKAGPTTLGPRSMAARKKFGERTMAAQQAKLPGVRASVGNTMDQMLATPKPGAMPSTLPATKGAVPGVGAKVARPAQGVQTMAERVASAVPSGPPLKSPPASMAPVGPKSLATVPSLEHLAAKHTPVAAASKGAPALGELAAQHMAQHAAPKLPKVAAKPVQTMAERVASKMPAHASLAVPGEKSHQQLLGEARKAETKYADSDKKKPLEKKHIGFNKLAGELAHEKGVDDPKAVAAAIGRKKYGAKGMAEKSAAARKTEMTKMEYGLALSELGACALCKKAEHSGPCM